MGLRKTLRRFVQNQRRKSAHLTDFSFSPFIWLLDRPPTGNLAVATTDEGWADDRALVQRVMKAYQRANEDFVPSDSFWDRSILKINHDIHEALMSEDEDAAASKLCCPIDNSHFWGFDSIAKAPKGATEPHQHFLEQLDPGGDWREQFSLLTQDKLVTLADVTGARKLNNPESPRKHKHESADEVLDKIEQVLGFTLDFPNPYAGEFGLQTSRGIVSYRSLQALYQAWRIAKIAAGKEDFKVLEIGAGLGRTAFFANRLGIKNYSVIDIPMTGAAQGYFLGLTLGEENINLWGENTAGSVNVLPASALDSLTPDYDLIVNVDSITEMAEDSMNGYWQFILKATPLFMSINHNENERSVSDLYAGNSRLQVSRYPYWMRRGYVEEYIRIGQPDA